MQAQRRTRLMTQLGRTSSSFVPKKKISRNIWLSSNYHWPCLSHFPFHLIRMENNLEEFFYTDEVLL